MSDLNVRLPDDNQNIRLKSCATFSSYDLDETQLLETAASDKTDLYKTLVETNATKDQTELKTDSAVEHNFFHIFFYLR